MSRAGAVLKAPRARRLLKWFAGIVAVFALLGFFAAPPLLKSIFQDQLSQSLHRKVSIARIEINPFALSAKLQDLSIQDGAGGESAGFQELYVNLSSASLFKMAVVVDQIRLQGLRLHVTRQAEGQYDISDLLDEWMKPKDEPDSGVPRFSLNNIQVLGANLVFDDRPADKVHTVSDLNLTLPFISSLPYQAEIEVVPSFSAKIDGSELALTGQSKPFSDNHESELKLDLDHFDLSILQPYLPDSLPFKLKAGSLDSELKAVFKEGADQVFSLSVVGGLHVSGFDLAEKGGQPLLGWQRLDVDLEKVDPFNRQIVVSRVGLDGLDANLAVNRQGEFNVLRLLDKLAQPGKTPDKEPPAKPWQWSLGGLAATGGVIRWHDESNQPAVSGIVGDLQVKVGKVDSRLTDPIEIEDLDYRIDLGDRFKVARMSLKGIKVDLPAHRVDIAEVVNRQTRAVMVRNKAGQIEWVSSPVLKTVRATHDKVEEGKPWVGRVGKLSIEDLGFRFEDQTARPVAVQALSGVNLTAEDLTNEPKKKGHLLVSAMLNKTGRLRIDGSVQIFPLDLALKLETQTLSLSNLQPYFDQYLNVALTRGQFSSKGLASARIDPDGFKAGYQGSMTLGSLRAVDKANRADFLKWKSLYLGGIDFRLEPMAIKIGEIALTDFYSRLILNRDGRLNLQEIVREKDAPASGQPAPSAQAKPETDKKPLPIKIAKVTLNNGTLNFSDFFVKPNYSVNITKLGGRVSGLSSDADSVADLDLRGTYAGSAPVQIQGKLNPLAAKSFLDIKAAVTGVDLVDFSPYSGKYAGYNIEKGKLSLDVAYKLENRQLSAENKLFIDQFTFGDPVDSPDATNLPVNLAISLLKNRRGEIDLNLPISGSLEDPEFSVGGLIVKVIVNLFTKAVTSPFALLGSMFGSGEELSNIAFAPGRATFDETAGKKLEALANALKERPALKLEITGRVDPVADKEGLKRVAIERAMQAEKAKDIEKRGGDPDAAGALAITPSEYPTYLRKAYRAADFPKPRNLVGFQKDLPVEEMEKLMLTNLPATEDDIARLGKQRAENVLAWLSEQGKVPPERLFLVPPKRSSDAEDNGSRVDFSLR